MPSARRNYKDSMFRDLFGSPDRKRNALELYNALADTSYDDPDELELTTLDDVIYLNVKNDVSFLVGNEMVLFEHQSSRNPNMPLRGLLYFARLYSAYVAANDLNLYGTRLVELPSPRYLVFCSGEDELPDALEYRLSDSFSHPGCVEVLATALNVNAGCNTAIMDACEALRGYAAFVAKVRAGMASKDLGRAVSDAIDECIAEGVLASYLRGRKAEVIDMFMTEYDAERQRELDRRDAREEGVEQGIKQGVRQGIRQGVEQTLAHLVESGAITADQAAAELAAAGVAASDPAQVRGRQD